MIRWLATLAAAVYALAATTAGAKMREIRDGAFTAADPGKAYLLYHLPEGENDLPAQPIFMRMGAGGAGADDPLFATRNGRTFAKAGPVDVHLLEVPPGDYLIYGLSMPGAGPTLATCFCLGTVSFKARPGVVTDLGAILIGQARAPSGFPELASETGFGPSIDTGFHHPVGALRPTSTARIAPGPLARVKIERASFRAAGRFFDPRTGYVNRLAPLSGVLRYERGRPINVATGAPVPDHLAR